ncbi:type VI secretion system protein TssA [Pseudomonas sp. DWP3-1-2]|uniref:type VI secretion system protein TssA n=1 Tax=Pseudomonas sp. DWP3-1-2 TaxID=2804645 RepID=UPI003CEEB1F0
MSCLDQELGAFAISVANPAGANPREGAAFSLAQIEVEKLTNIHADSGVDWHKVADSCARVLRDEGKDINAAVWLVCAWTTIKGLPGLATGVHVLREMLELYWDTLTPPPARLRARRNQAEWMLEWLTVKVEESFEAVPGEQLAALLDDWDAIDALWRDRDAEGPGFFALRRRLSQLPVQAAIAPMVTPPDEVPAQSGAGNVAPATVSQPQPAPVKALPTIALAQPLGSLESDEAIETAVSGVFSSLIPLIGFCLESRTTLPLLFRLNRQLAWTTLDQAPPSQGNTTRLPGPSEAEFETFNRLQSAGEALDVVRFCEGRLNSYPFWLDLNRASHSALSRLGAVALAGATSVAQETRHFLARIPALAELTFADGQPFADGATRSWLEGLEPATRSGAADALQTLIDEAAQDAADGRLSDAMNRLQGGLREVSGGRDRFRLRCAQCLLLQRFDPRAPLQVAVDVLLQEAKEQGLDRWEPDLVRPLLELALSQEDGSSKALWAQQLAAMDLPAFWRLASPQAS